MKKFIYTFLILIGLGLFASPVFALGDFIAGYTNGQNPNMSVNTSSLFSAPHSIAFDFGSFTTISDIIIPVKTSANDTIIGVCLIDSCSNACITGSDLTHTGEYSSRTEITFTYSTPFDISSYDNLSLGFFYTDDYFLIPWDYDEGYTYDVVRNSDCYVTTLGVEFLIYGSAPVIFCGDDIINGDETCDDGDDNGSDGYCNATCDGQTEYCGDDIINLSETCDDGDDNGSDGYCNATCDGQTEYCGDDIINNGEYCDDGVDNGTIFPYCNEWCTDYAVSICGNDVIEDEEICDDGENNGQSGYCNTSCSLPFTYFDDVFTDEIVLDNAGIVMSDSSKSIHYIGVPTNPWIVQEFSGNFNTEYFYGSDEYQISGFNFLWYKGYSSNMTLKLDFYELLEGVDFVDDISLLGGNATLLGSLESTTATSSVTEVLFNEKFDEILTLNDDNRYFIKLSYGSYNGYASYGLYYYLDNYELCSRNLISKYRMNTATGYQWTTKNYDFIISSFLDTNDVDLNDYEELNVQIISPYDLYDTSQVYIGDENLIIQNTLTCLTGTSTQCILEYSYSFEELGKSLWLFKYVDNVLETFDYHLNLEEKAYLKDEFILDYSETEQTVHYSTLLVDENNVAVSMNEITVYYVDEVEEYGGVLGEMFGIFKRIFPLSLYYDIFDIFDKYKNTPTNIEPLEINMNDFLVDENYTIDGVLLSAELLESGLGDIWEDYIYKGMIYFGHIMVFLYLISLLFTYNNKQN